jgi:hypothetical protein
MNRMAPLVRRRTRNAGSFPVAAARTLPTIEQAASWLDDAKLFAAGWVGGLVVFGTLFA